MAGPVEPKCLLDPADLGADVGFRDSEKLGDRVVAVAVEVEDDERPIQFIQQVENRVVGIRSCAPWAKSSMSPSPDDSLQLPENHTAVDQSRPAA